MTAQTHTSNLAPTVVPHAPRLKLTAACEPCRKRKARCSGTEPCNLCQKSSLQCEYNYDRQRRGPRPKNNSTSSVSSNLRTKGTEHTRGASDDAIATLPEPATTLIATTDASASRPISEIHLDSDPPEGLVKEAIRKTLASGKSSLSMSDPLPSPDLILHLLTVFSSHVHNHQPWIIGHKSLPLRLTESSCSPALLYAICAASIKFSRHPSTTSPTGRSYRENLARVARGYTTSAPEREWIADRVQCLSILAIYEMGEANGTQAWCDISAAYALIQIAKISDLVNKESSASIDISLTCLCILERELCLGHDLRPSTIVTPSGSHSVRPVEHVDEMTQAMYLVEILDLMLQIQIFSKESFAAQSEPVWSVRSQFMAYKQTLDRFLIRHSDEFQFASEDNDTAEESLERKIFNLHSSLAWHCSVILLNRVFLPLPHPPSSMMSSLPTLNFPEDNDVQFPLAPKPFVDERVQACQASASRICGLCRDVLDCDIFLLPSFMGYCCFQSSIVLINQLRRSRGTDQNITEELKINFTILGAMRKFYDPAHIWIETLFKIHQPASSSPLKDMPRVEKFATYFSRFDHVKEPPYIPLQPPSRRNDPPLLVVSKDKPPKDRNDGNEKSKQSSESLTDAQKTFLSEYRSSLQSHIVDIDGNEKRKIDTAASGKMLGVGSSSQPQPTSNQILPQSHQQDFNNSQISTGPQQDFTNSIDNDFSQSNSQGNASSLDITSEVPFSSQPSNVGGSESHTISSLIMSYDNLAPLTDFNFSAELMAGERAFNPESSLLFPEHLDWMLCDTPSNDWSLSGESMQC